MKIFTNSMQNRFVFIASVFFFITEIYIGNSHCFSGRLPATVLLGFSEGCKLWSKIQICLGSYLYKSAALL